MRKPDVHAAAAADLWTQVFSRLAADPAAAVMDPSHDEQADRVRGHDAMRAAGWSDDAIARMDAAEAARIAAAPTTSPGVNPRVEAQYAMLADDVEAAMARLGHASQQRIARGIEPRVGPYAAKTNVVMTDESIITVGAFLFRYCGLVARAFVRTLCLDPWFWEREDFDEARARSLLARKPDLLRYWMNIHVSFAVSGTHAFVPFLPSTMREVVLMEQVARAMEIFAIAHEYGHHHLDHGRQMGADPRAEEFAADAFALRISEEVETRPIIMENPYLLSGAGALVLLASLDTLRTIEGALGARPVDNGTHPTIAERIARFEGVRVLFPKEHRWLKGFRTASGRIMRTVDALLLEGIGSVPKESLDGWRRLRTEYEQWKDLTG